MARLVVLGILGNRVFNDFKNHFQVLPLPIPTWRPLSCFFIAPLILPSDIAMKLIQTLSSGKNGKMNWLTLGEKWQKQSLMTWECSLLIVNFIARILYCSMELNTIRSFIPY